MGVRVRLSRNTSAYVPFWAAILFWLVVGPIVLAGLLLWGIAKIVITLVRAIHAHHDSKAVS